MRQFARELGTATLAVILVLGALALYGLFDPPGGPVVVPAQADTLSIPYTFSPNTLIKSSDFNANFDAIEAIVNGSINDVNISAGGITGSTKLANTSVTLAKMAADSVDSSKIVAGSIATSDIANDAITTALVATDAVTNTDQDSEAGGATLGAGTWDPVGQMTITTGNPSAAVFVFCSFQINCTTTEDLDLRATYDCGGGDTLIGQEITDVYSKQDASGKRKLFSWSVVSTIHSDNTSCIFECQARGGTDCTWYDANSGLLEIKK